MAMLPESQTNLNGEMQFLPKDDFSSFDPELYPAQEIKRREAQIRQYVDIQKDIRNLAYVASGLGVKGLSTL